MYTIEVDFKTGDSFNSEEVVGRRIGLCWHDKTLARKALQSIKEHYELYQEYEGYLGRSRDDVFAEVKTKAWFRHEDESWMIFEGDWCTVCYVEMDDGTYRNVGTGMWCGYFEQLHCARVVVEDEQDEQDEQDGPDEVRFNRTLWR